MKPIFEAIYLEGNEEHIFTQKDLEGSYSLIYFYPKDMTPGCTLEACEFRDNYNFFISKNIKVYAVSGDSLESHSKFSTQHNLPFILVSDTSHSMSRAFDVYKQKSMFGKKYMGIERSTFIIGPQGEILYKWEKVKPIGHTQEVKRKFEEIL